MSQLSADDAADASQRHAWALSRRRAARDHHPDRGGDIQAYLAALAEVDQRFGVPRKAPTTPIAAAMTPAASRPRQGLLTAAGVTLRRRARAQRRAVRAWLPRWAPGSRRYIQLGTGPVDRESGRQHLRMTTEGDQT